MISDPKLTISESDCMEIFEGGQSIAAGLKKILLLRLERLGLSSEESEK